MHLTVDQEAAALALAGEANLYLCGPPGRGKTQVVDWFVAVVERAGPIVLRRHLHVFFADLHAAIDRRAGWSGGVDEVLGGVDVLCLDEFAVHDPADGVFLDRVLRAVADAGVRVVVTSNRTPSEQMPNPLFHTSFTPTIGLIQEMFTVLYLGVGRDLRADGGTSGFRAGSWTVGDETVPGVGLVQSPGGRPIRLAADGPSMRIRFADLCDVPANAADYRWLANRFDHWVIVGVEATDRVDPLARWAIVLDIAHDADIRIDVWAGCVRKVMADALTAVLPDADRAVSRMGAWTVSPPSSGSAVRRP
ncbi:cell division protein ZapE [Gordonia spumicola]|uniref:Cell division protein ZapE n=1 Tax=Gordonia spumicola TaxID=589161 RepID=A0A7I9VBW1_9ACTN|nr:AFG1/ZapE family ATPase [Gordonia spumicola]GEE02603.1 cell division protein ZapE [Gordonia spumicola]